LLLGDPGDIRIVIVGGVFPQLIGIQQRIADVLLWQRNLETGIGNGLDDAAVEEQHPVLPGHMRLGFSGV
jgi:hypothetical protein